MPSYVLPLKKMTLAQKMGVIEQVWESLRQEDADAASPAWHKELLAERKALYAAGKAKFSPWSEAKERIKRRVHARKAS